MIFIDDFQYNSYHSKTNLLEILKLNILYASHNISRCFQKLDDLQIIIILFIGFTKHKKDGNMFMTLFSDLVSNLDLRRDIQEVCSRNPESVVSNRANRWFEKSYQIRASVRNNA